MLGIFFLFSILRDSKATSPFKGKDKLLKPETSLIQTDTHNAFLDKTQKSFIELENNPQEAVIKDEGTLEFVINKLNALRL